MTRPGGGDDAGDLRREILSGSLATDPDRLRAALLRFAALVHEAVVEPPLCWPRRCAGSRLRVGLIVAADEPGIVPVVGLQAVLAKLESMRTVTGGSQPARSLVDRCSLSLLVATPRLPVGSAERLRSIGVGAIAFGGVGAEVAARTIADADFDAIFDLAGLAAPSAEVLARRPARHLVAIGDGGLPHLPPLVDRVIEVPRGPSLFESLDVHLLDELSARLQGADADRPDPAAVRAAWHGALAAHRNGDLAAAGHAYRELLEVQPDSAWLHWFFGQSLLAANRPGEAATELRRALALAPEWPAARLALSAALLAAGHPGAARAEAQRVLRRHPRDAAAARRIAIAETSQGDHEGAIAHFRLAASLDPADADSRRDLGVALMRRHRVAEAEAAFDAAVRIAPSLPSLFNLAMARAELGRADLAVDGLARVLAAEPSNALAHKALCETLQRDGRHGDWLQAFLRFERACPASLAMAVHGLEAAQYLGDLDRVDRYLLGLEQDRFTPFDPQDEVDTLEQLLYLLLFFDLDPALHLRFYRRYDALMRARVRDRGGLASDHDRGHPSSGREPDRRKASSSGDRMRIGYLSADLRNHVMGKMMWEPIHRHDRRAFEVACYSLSPIEDDWTRRFEGAVDRFVRLADLSDDEAARRIADDDLDLLVDLCGHTRGARPAILAARPARAALEHVATAGALGLSAVDFKLGDELADPPASRAFLIERLLPMQGCAYPYRSVEPSPESILSRAALGVPQNAVVIGAFVSLMKLSRRCLRVWKEVLDRIPRAVLAFSPNHPAAGDCYASLLERHGIARTRIRFVPQGRDEAENQARYRIVDLVLDPMPYGGVNGTIEALAMAVPVVTLRGERHQERTGYSMLANLGVPELVAASAEEYVELAVRLANDSAFAAGVRERIRAGLGASVLTDAELYTRNLEAAYREAIRRACAGGAAARE